MIRRIIEIDKEKCNGCGLCAKACHEGAIGMVDGKATLLRDDYCDGLGDCLPVCPTGAITFVEREAAAYDEAAVQANMAKKGKTPCACPGSQSKLLEAQEKMAAKGKKKLLLLGCLPDCVSGLCKSNWHPSKLLTLTVRSCSLRQTVPHTLTAISMRNS